MSSENKTAVEDVTSGNDTTGALEALLFVSDEPTSAATFAEMLGVETTEVTRTLKALRDEYETDRRGFQLREVAGGWRFYSNPTYHEIIERYVLSWDTRRLSQAALETLAVIAYRQPVTRGGINAVRGVNSEAVVSSLVEKGLVREAGRDKASGNAILYATTKSFLEKFGLKSTKDLPPIEEFMPSVSEQEAITERLDAAQ
ncbi:MAG: SMC-Scp complex subunit ScpB [Coriobacteriia bacterium]|nr:SMC-Scp complex subunit ScpB [Coriobacteriia bacterium]